MRFFARPTLADGSDRLGTLRVLSGSYGSQAAFIRYRVRPYAVAGERYNLYFVDDASRWHSLGVFIQEGANA